MKTTLFAIFSFFGLLLLTSLASAHQTGESTFVSHVRVDERVVDVLVAFPGRDAAHHLNMDLNNDEIITDEEMLGGFHQITAYVDSKLSVTNNGTICAGTEQRASPVKGSSDAFWYMKSFQCEQPLGVLEFTNTILLESRGSYTHLGRIQIGERIDATVFNTQFPTYRLNVDSAAPSLSEVIPRYLWEGVVHILFGPDHVLFVILLVLITLGVRRLLIVVTSFTVAHSVTLILAALEIFDIPAEIIEPIIALSIGYLALEIIFRKTEPKFLALYTFGFGLVHGFGFSYVLRDNVGLPTEALVPALAAFNVGVELGQVAIVLLLFPIRHWVSKKEWEPRAIKTVAGLSLAVAVFWFVERVAGALMG